MKISSYAFQALSGSPDGISFYLGVHELKVKTSFHFEVINKFR